MSKQIVSSVCFAVLCIVVAAGATAAEDQKSAAKGQIAQVKAKRSAKSSDTATYVGCLRTEDGGKKFVLTEVGGPNAPASRNWKTAFITKKAGKLEIVAPGLRLRDQVGHTVQLTGRRDDKIFRAHSMKVVGSTCR